MRVIGLLSGTSADGIDAALCEIGGAPPHLTMRLVRAQTIAYDARLRERILAAMRRGSAGADEVCLLNFAIGEAFAQAALTVAQGEPVDLIGSHGQTLWHQVEADGRVSATLQIGEPAVIAERTGATVINSFRARDVAAGGQGAPLVGYLDWLLLRHPTEWRAVQNIGGIGNVTFLPPINLTPHKPNLTQNPTPLRARRGDGGEVHMLAFDTGPGNALIDSAMTIITDGSAHYDDGGRFAAQGSIDRAWLDRLLQHAYFRQPPPKTTGRELFGTDYAEQLVQDGRVRGLTDADSVATLTALTAHSIATAYRDFAPAPIAECILAGGGRHNATLVRMLEQQLAPARVSRSEDHGIDGDFKEALLFALLAYETWHNRPGCLPEQTGATHASILGSITPGANFAALMSRLFR
ncbi:MAG: anhydro-N-acetylmuramic acid kinase [Chloroflexota bacterium]|nr:anhydro-N-acetylmuramic acid kinase [Chloroflexota bacterium]